MEERGRDGRRWEGDGCWIFDKDVRWKKKGRDKDVKGVDMIW